MTAAIFEANSAKTSNTYNFGVRFRSVKCSTDNHTVLVKGCYLKPYSRKVVTLNLHGTFGKPLIKPWYIIPI